MDLGVSIDIVLGGIIEIVIFIGEKDWMLDVFYGLIWYLNLWVKVMIKGGRVEG